jgi:hypothetical protein
MKITKIFLLAFMLPAAITTNAQVGIGTSSPNASAQLDVSSTTKGFLPPRMTTAQRDAITATPGLTIYNTTKNSFECYNGSSWYSTVHYIGEGYGGGIVFYVYDNGQHGLVAATTDQSTGIRWYGGNYTNTMALADGMGAGRSNTAIIIGNQGYGDSGSYAARVCNEYSVTVNDVTYSDWYLPSKHELNLLYLQKNMVGGFVNDFYWCSTDYPTIYAYFAWRQSFDTGLQNFELKYSTYHVRAIRAF